MREQYGTRMRVRRGASIPPSVLSLKRGEKKTSSDRYFRPIRNDPGSAEHHRRAISAGPSEALQGDVYDEAQPPVLDMRKMISEVEQNGKHLENELLGDHTGPRSRWLEVSVLRDALPAFVLDSDATKRSAMNGTPRNPDEEQPAAAGSGEQLMVAFSRGSANAVSELFSRYKQPLFGFFRRCVADPVQAEDLTQETFLAVLRESSRRRTIGFTEELLDKIQKDDPATFSCQYINEPLVAGQQRAVSSRHS